MHCVRFWLGWHVSSAIYSELHSLHTNQWRLVFLITPDPCHRGGKTFAWRWSWQGSAGSSWVLRFKWNREERADWESGLVSLYPAVAERVRLGKLKVSTALHSIQGSAWSLKLSCHSGWCLPAFSKDLLSTILHSKIHPSSFISPVCSFYFQIVFVF